MKTENELYLEFQQAVNPIVDTYWLSKPKKANGVFAVYRSIDLNGTYSFGINRESERRVFQVDLYVDPSELFEANNLVESIKTALEAIHYRLIDSGNEFQDDDLNKVVKVSRWEIHNV